jgi:acyl CoA:acetate/3-ketoacid CoA transferase
VDPPKKQHQDNAMTHHLPTLSGTSVIPKNVHTTIPISKKQTVERGVVINRKYIGEEAIAGLGIGSVIVFLLLRVLL